MGRTGEVEEAVGDDMLGGFKDLPEGTRGGYAIVLEPDGEYSVFPEEWLGPRLVARPYNASASCPRLDVRGGNTRRSGRWYAWRSASTSANTSFV